VYFGYHVKKGKTSSFLKLTRRCIKSNILDSFSDTPTLCVFSQFRDGDKVQTRNHLHTRISDSWMV